MLKSLLFSLKRFLSPESPLTRTADQTHPENTITAENQTSTEDDRYKALLRRLDSIESNLKAKQHIDDALKAFNAKARFSLTILVSLIKSARLCALKFSSGFLLRIVTSACILLIKSPA